MRSSWTNAWPVLVLLSIWQAAALWIGKPLLVPEPYKVLITLAELIQTTVFWQGVWTSVSNLAQAWLMALMLIASLTLVSLMNQHVRAFNDRMCSMFMPMPAITWLPVMMLMFGIGQQTIMAMVIWGTLWMTYHQFIINIDQAKNQWQSQVRNLRLDPVRSVIKVYLPAMAGSTLAGLQVSFGLAWRAQMALEIMFGAISTFSSIGSMMMDERANMDTPMVWSYMIVIMIVGILMHKIFSSARARVRW